MGDHEKTREQLAAELKALRQRAAALETRLHKLQAQIEFEKNYNTIFHNTHTMMMLVDPATADIIDANTAACTFYGYPHDVLTSLKITDINMASENEVRQEMKRAETEQRNHFYFRHRLASGEVRNVEVYSGPIQWAGRQLLYSVIHDITARRSAEKALSESEARYRALFEESPVSLWEEDFSECKAFIDTLCAQGVTDLRAYFEQHPEAVVTCAHLVKIIRVNQVALDLFHAASETDLLGNLDQLFGPESYDAFREELLTLAAGNTHFRAEILGYPLQGDPIQTILWMSVAPGSEDTWEKIIVSVLDITERRQAEAALRESEERFRLLADVAFEGIMIHENGRLLELSEPCARLFGYTVDKLVGGNAFDLFAPESRPLVRQHVSANYEQPYEAVGLRADGSTFPVEVLGKATTYKGRKVRVVAIRNLTERKKAQEALETERKLLRTMIDTLPDSVYVKDTEGRFVMVNAKLIQDVGASSQADMLGKTDFDFFPANHAAEWRTGEEIIIQTGQPIINREEPAVRPDGQPTYFLTSKVPLRDAEGNITRIVGITRDVTELRAAEARAVALKIERERVKLLQRFLNDASHDLRTPLASIKASLAVLSMLRQAPDPARQQRHLEILEMQTRHLQRLLDDLLSIARLEDTVRLQPKPADLNTLAAAIIREQRRAAQRRRHQIEFVPDPTLPAIWADPARLHRALTTLVTNALNYTPDGGVITLRTYRQHDHAVVEVHDMGIGMSETDLSHLFEQFYRADPARSTTTGGLGLGLSIARQLIEAHHGHIEVESTVGVGSTFKVFLPLSAPV